jgi:hypothetical protein
MTDPSTSPKTPTGPAVPEDPFSLTLRDVHVLASAEATPAEGDGGARHDTGAQLAVPGMSLVLDQIGITVLKPDGSVGAVLAWGAMSRVATVDRAPAPGGGEALVLEAVTESRTHRFLVHTDDPAELEAVIAEVVAARTGPTRKRRRGRRVAVLVALAILVAAGVALALLVTVGGVKL